MDNPQPKLVFRKKYWNNRASRCTNGQFMVYQCNYCEYVYHQSPKVFQHQLLCFNNERNHNSQASEKLEGSSPPQPQLIEKNQAKEPSSTVKKIKQQNEGITIKKESKRKRLQKKIAQKAGSDKSFNSNREEKQKIFTQEVGVQTEHMEEAEKEKDICKLI